MNLLTKIFIGLTTALLFGFWRARVRHRQSKRVLAALEDTYYLAGRDVGLIANVPTHTLYVILARLEDQGVVESHARPGGPERGYRPQRCYIRTEKGRARLDGEAHMKALRR